MNNIENVPTGYIESKYVLPIYEHIVVGRKNYKLIKYFIAYKVVAKKEKSKSKKHIEKALLKIKVLTGKDAGSVYSGKYIYVTDGAYDEKFELMFADENCHDEVYLYERDGEDLLNDIKLRDLWIHNFDENGDHYGSNRLMIPEYVKVSELKELQNEYNNGVQIFIQKEKEKQTIIPDSIF